MPKPEPGSRSVAHLPPGCCRHLAMPTSATTLLQAIRGLPLPVRCKPSIVGVDDWALRTQPLAAEAVVGLAVVAGVGHELVEGHLPFAARSDVGCHVRSDGVGVGI